MCVAKALNWQDKPNAKILFEIGLLYYDHVHFYIRNAEWVESQSLIPFYSTKLLLFWASQFAREYSVHSSYTAHITYDKVIS